MTAHRTDDESGFEPSWFHPGLEVPPTWRPLITDTPRIWTQLLRARVFVAVVLVCLQTVLLLHGSGKPGWWLPLMLVYAGATAVTLRWSPPQPDSSMWASRWAATVWLDIGLFALLQGWPGSHTNFAPLFLLPILMASLLGPRTLALGSAAAATLVLLADAALDLLSTPSAVVAQQLLQSSLTSTGFFVVALLASQLTQRLQRERDLADHSRQEALIQSDVNALIVNGLNEGILVIDAQGAVWHANPAAIEMLDLHPQAGTSRPALPVGPAWSALLDWSISCLQQQTTDERELGIPIAGTIARKLHARCHPTANGVCVIFLEDLREVEARVRNEKLAAMGRMSAAVAHEIRNPLSAITQANALLGEENLPPLQQRLIAMIGHNAQRLARTVDDILDLTRVEARPAPHTASTPVLDTLVSDVLRDWRLATPSAPSIDQHLATNGQRVHFDPEHLRRVLVNLLDNARRHASGDILVRSTDSPEALELSVWSAGPALPPARQLQLFEPFSSSDSRSSGLGLYICRELCQRYRAEIGYRPERQYDREGNVFYIRMPPWRPEPPGP